MPRARSGSAGLAAHFADPIVGAVAPRVRPVTGNSAAGRYLAARAPLDLGPAEARVAPLTRLSYVPTAALMVRAGAVPAGGFDPGLRYGEDVDLIWRMIGAGWRVRYDPAAEVRHAEPGRWPAVLARRFRYGNSAAPLARRHPGLVPPLILQAWPAAAVAALLAGRPVTAIAAYAAGTGQLVELLREWDVPARGVLGPMAGSVRQTWLDTGRWTAQYVLPVAAAGLAMPGGHSSRARLARRLALASLVLGPPAAEWLRSRPGSTRPGSRSATWPTRRLTGRACTGARWPSGSPRRCCPGSPGARCPGQPGGSVFPAGGQSSNLSGMLTARVNGTDIAYTDSEGDGPAVVLSHGYLMDHTMFDPQLPVLAPEFRVITWDERGFGDTSADGPFSYWDSARDVLGLLDHLGLDRAVLGGMSQGGFLSMRAALLEPGRVRALALIDTQAGQEDPAVAPGYEQMEEIWLAQGPEPVQEVVASIILGGIDPQPWYAKWAELDREGLTHSFRCLMDRDDITGRLGEIGCPALILHGTADAAIPMAKAEELRDGLGGPVELVAVEGGSHASNVSHPDQVNPALLRFLRSLG